MVAAARDIDGGELKGRFFATSTYLSTATVLYKRGDFTPEEIEALRKHSRLMSFDEVYYPGIAYDDGPRAETLKGYREQFFGNGLQGDPEGKDPEPTPATDPDKPPVVPATIMGRIAWQHLIFGGWDKIADAYVFDTRILTNHQPYFAAYIKVKDLWPPATAPQRCRTSGGTCCCGRRAASPPARRCRWCRSRWCSAGARSSAAIPASSAR